MNVLLRAMMTLLCLLSLHSTVAFAVEKDCEVDLSAAITKAALDLCWKAARNDITHESLKEAQEFSRAEDRAI